ncbi:hypothetical protein [Paenibacillus sp. GP183]|uniref:hypothetical protein n=1 Tax=Paenibacillus sp. GP183 TaxID=1882751 RepID=UPI00089A025E|nr:hypothetical protein [Paenibacillus sp. GP183]SEB74521.1 hypothetical protein SAMN05443246_1774 [Paenibacillus sp. GP183]
MEITADVSFIILLLGLTGLLAGYFFYACPLQLQHAEPDFINGSSLVKKVGQKLSSGLDRLHWIRRKVPGSRSGRSLPSGEEDSLFIMSNHNFS